MENDTIKIIKLRGSENWSTWKFQVRVTLLSCEAFDVVSGGRTRPAPPAPLGPSATDPEKTTHEAAMVTYNRNLKEFLKIDGIAQRIIVTSLERTPMTHLFNCESALEMWNKLHGIYESRSEASVHMLQQKWFSFKKDPSDDIQTLISKVEDMRFSLNALNENISEGMAMTKILMTLLPTFSHFVSAWDCTAPAERTLENLSSRLIMEEIRMAATDSSENSALVVNKPQENLRKKTYLKTR